LLNNASYAHPERTADGHLEGVVAQTNCQYGCPFGYSWLLSQECIKYFEYMKLLMINAWEENCFD
jgi:hypothetical protein